MSKVILISNADPREIWPGIATVNRAGVELFAEMLALLEATDESPNLGELTCLENWSREGQPLHQVVTDYLQRARAMGTDVESGFCAALGDFIGMSAQDGPVGSARYKSFARALHEAP
jgi:hypothetical protein